MQDSYLKRGNRAFLKRDYKLALEYYREAVEEKPYLKNTLAFNTEWIQNHFKNAPSILVVFHVFHEDIVDDCARRIANIPFHYDLLITTPHSNTHPAIVKVKSLFPDATIRFHENKGRDMAPFVQNWSLIQKYDLCCKLHTKKGDPEFAVDWKELLLDGILGTPGEIDAIVGEFDRNPEVAIAGNELLYAPHPLFIGKNGPNIERICAEHSIKTHSHAYDGFFMGSMFWIRPSDFSFAERLVNLEFQPERGEIDGQPEHALERIFGSMTLSDEKKILLTWRNQEKVPFFQKVSPDHETRMLAFKQYFNAIASAKKAGSKICGDIRTENDPSISRLTGWLAIRGDALPREAKVVIDDSYHIDVMCYGYREDLKAHHINAGNHGFFIDVPAQFQDSTEHEYKLYDKATGTFIKKISCVKSVADQTRRLDRVSDF